MVAALPKANDRVRVGDVDSAINWWFATVESLEGKKVVVRIRCKSDNQVIRNFSVDQVRSIEGNGMDRTWMLGLVVDIPSKKKTHSIGMVVNVKDTITIEYAPTLREKRAFQSTLEHLYNKSAQFAFDDMPWNQIEDAESGPSISLGTEICKEFAAGWFFGTVDEGPSFRIFATDCELQGRGYFYHITYTDGDREWLSLEEVQALVKQAVKQRKKESSGPASAKNAQNKSSQLDSKAKKSSITRRRRKNEDADETEKTEGLLVTDNTMARHVTFSGARPLLSDNVNVSRSTKRHKKNDDEYHSENENNTQASRRQGGLRQSKTGHSGSVIRQRATRRAAAVGSRVHHESDSEGDDGLDGSPEDVAVSEPPLTASTPKRDEDPVYGFGDLTYSLCQEINSTLHSRECMFGATSVERLLTFHKRFPDKSCREKMIDLIVFGPLGHNKYTRFPDKHRTIAGARAIGCQLSLCGMHEAFARDLVEFGWDKCLQQMLVIGFAAEGDEQRTNHDAVLRIGETLYVKAHCMEFFGRLLEYEQERCSPSADAVARKTLLAEIARSGRIGSREALELAVQAYMGLVFKHGHFLIGPRKDLCSLPGGPTFSCLEETMSAAARLYEALGKVVSILAWLYGAVETEPVSSVSHLIGTMFLNELQLKSFDPSPFLEDPGLVRQHWESIKLRFILGFRRELVPQLRPLLANKLSVARLYNDIFSDDL